MGMISILVRVSNSQLASFLKESSLLEEYIDSSEIEKTENLLDLDKSWDGILYLLTGHGLNTIEEAEGPFANVLFSGQIIDEDQDMGYGPAQYLTPEQVKDINGPLSAITPDDLRKKYNAEAMNENGVYPQGWENEKEEEDYLIGYFEELKEFYATAADNGEAIISYIS
jgi:hypothetical protein